MTSINRDSHQVQIYVASAILLSLATVGVALRLLARRISSAKLWWDDYTIVIALMLHYGQTTIAWLQVALGGSGLHTIMAGGPVGFSRQKKYLQLFLGLVIAYQSIALTLRTSIILLYHRLFGVVRSFHYVLIATWSIVAAYFIACVTTSIFQCKPVSYQWDRTLPNGSCIDEALFFRWNAVANLLIDLLVLSLAPPMIWRLHLPVGQRASLIVVFLLGAFVVIASVVRVTSFEQYRPDDLTYTGYNSIIWSDVEQSFGIVCACLPCMRPLFGRLMGVGPGSASHRIKMTSLGSSKKKRSQSESLSSSNMRRECFTKLDNDRTMMGTTALATAEGARLESGRAGILMVQSVGFRYDDLDNGDRRLGRGEERGAVF